MSFRNDRLVREPIPMSIVKLVGRVEEYKGKQQLYYQQSPQILESLRKVAIIQSTESSNRIEGIEIPHRQLRAIVEDRVAPSNRSQGGVAGYRDVLATIHASHLHIPVTPNTILQLHRDLYRYAAAEGGRWKTADNRIDWIMPDGTHVLRFSPLSAVQTPHAMDELCAALRRHTDTEDANRLLLIATFALDFLCIHPFLDGNGRMARLLTLLLLYQSGYEVGRFVSIERVIEDSRDSYYDALYESSQGWREGIHSLMPWWEYFLGVMLAAYDEFESRVGMVTAGRGAKSSLVRQMVERTIGDFSMSELLRLCPGVSRPLVRQVLKQMREEGLVECMGLGVSARWRKTTPQ